jgi:hypothetical protein
MKCFNYFRKDGMNYHTPPYCVAGLHEYLDECTSPKRKLTTQHTNESEQESESEQEV